MPRILSASTSTLPGSSTPSLDDARGRPSSPAMPPSTGSFFYSVETTGVYCRPSCPARRPKRDNVRFHDTAEDAERAGFRPCKRCKPDQPSLAEHHAEKVAEACRLIETAEEEPKLDDLAAAVGLEPLSLPSHLQGGARRDAQGLCHGAAQQARARRARRSAYGDRGDLRCRLQLERPLLRHFVRGARHDADRFPLGRRQRPRSNSPSASARSAPFSSRRAIRASAPSCSATTRRACSKSLQDQFPRARLIGGDTAFERLAAEVIAFRRSPAGRSRPASRYSRHRLSASRLGRAAAHPAGSTASYAEIAKAIGAPKSVRAVARACATNRIAVAIPCHRVVRADGSLSGYRGGVERKRALLAREAKQNLMTNGRLQESRFKSSI